MSGSKKKKTPAEELIESLLKDVGELGPADGQEPAAADASEDAGGLEGLVAPPPEEEKGFMLSTDSESYDTDMKTEFESTQHDATNHHIELEGGDELREAMGALALEDAKKSENDLLNAIPVSPSPEPTVALENAKEDNKTIAIPLDPPQSGGTVATVATTGLGDSDKTVAVAGYQVRSESDYGDKVKVTVGQNRMSSGYSAWNTGGSAESNLAQAENLRIAQEKIIELENENEKLRQQNEELMAASEIIKERSDLLSSQLNEYKKDRDGFEDSYKNEIVLLKNHLARKDTELQRTLFKTEELESRLKFDMKKIRVRERELENRLELIRAEKNAIVKNKDEQILDLRRKMDVLQMEVESYRQKCVELNKQIESSQESFKRTTRALRLAMANLELQEENKVPLKKVD